MATKQDLKNGGTFSGNLHKDGGTPVIVDDKVIAEAELGEVIINRKSSRKHCKKLSEINQDGGGVPLNCEEPHKVINKTGFKKEKGGVIDGEGSSTGTGSLYEFFTPDIVAKQMWDLAYHYGFSSGNVLEPGAGNGRLIKYAPDPSKVTAFEINKDNVDHLKKQYPGITVYDKSFETAFLQEPRFNSLIKDKKKPTWLPGYPFDLVIANPPYGKFTGFYASYFKYKTQFEHWFIEYSLLLLKSNALGVYLIPSSFLRNGISYTAVKERIFKQAHFVDAYRLPSNIFAKTQIGTDILILRKK